VLTSLENSLFLDFKEKGLISVEVWQTKKEKFSI
jgi:hypothetical protein